MATHFKHAALVGKYHAQGMRNMLDNIASALLAMGLQYRLDQDLSPDHIRVHIRVHAT